MTIEILKQSKVPNLDFTFFAVQELRIWCFGIFFSDFFSIFDSLLALHLDHSLFQ